MLIDSFTLNDTFNLSKQEIRKEVENSILRRLEFELNDKRLEDLDWTIQDPEQIGNKKVYKIDIFLKS